MVSKSRKNCGILYFKRRSQIDTRWFIGYILNNNAKIIGYHDLFNAATDR